MPTPRFAALPLALVPLLATLAPGQGLLVDERPDERVRLPRPWVRPTPEPAPGGYKIESIEVDATLSDQVARVQVAQKFRNTGSRPMEVAFLFPLPYDGAIDQMTLLVDGEEFEAKLLPADEAREAYEAIVRKNQDPALLEWVGHGLLRTSVFPVPAGAERTVTLRYTQLCRHSGGLTDFLFPLRAAKYTSEPLDRLKVRVAVDSKTPISSIYSPTHQLKVERPSRDRAVVTHEAAGVLPSEDFRLFIDSGQIGGAEGGRLGASVLSYRPNPDEPGYFLMLASPQLRAENQPAAAKTVLLVIDRSGSMNGEKIEQAKGAARFVLNNLREGDAFNIIAYDTDIASFRPELQPANDASRTAALAYVDALYAGGSTNIDGALERALGMLDDPRRPSYVLFLTDGLPTAGEKNEAKIVAHTEAANGVRARVFPFGVGYDVNSRLLDKLARANFGQTEYVRPDQDIEASVSRLYRRVGTPVLTDVEMQMAVDGSGADGVSRVYPRGVFDLFAGDQAVLVGRYARSGAARVTLAGALGGEEQSFSFPAELVAESGDDTDAFIGRLWATRRVGEIIDQIDLNGKNDELINELVDLATRHGIVTQYTSFLADEAADHNAVASNRALTRERAADLDEGGGRAGFLQRNQKLALQKAAAPAAEAAADAEAYGLTVDGLQLAQNRALGCPSFYDASCDHQRFASNIRQIGRKTFFQRTADSRQVWCDSSVDEAEQKNATRIERYSPEYFELITTHGRHVAPYLAVDEPVVIKLGGAVYTW